MEKLIIAVITGIFIGQCSPDQRPIDPAYHYPAGLEGVSIDSLESLARYRVGQVRDYPDGRYQLREVFYDNFGHGHFSNFGFGNSELAFMSWEERGVLHPVDSNPPGSEWWSEVNLEFIFWSELAALIHLAEAKPDSSAELPPQVWSWLDFIDEPSSRHWYRAHNSSIIAAYHQYAHLAREEIHPEQVFINMVLYRLLYAQAMVEKEHFTFGKLGEFLADPRGFAVNFIVHDSFFYPSEYPLTQEEQDIILGKKHSIGELEVHFMDDVLILPHAHELYETASKINRTPELMTFIDNGKPIYPFID
jgi:hypothetical protein